MILLHPFRASEYFYKVRHPRVLDDRVWIGRSSVLFRPKYIELVIILWISFMISSLFSFSFDTIKASGFWANTKALLVFGSILIYPLLLWVQFSVWKLIIKFAMKLYSFNTIDEDEISVVLENSFLSGCFAIVPYVGGLLSLLSFYTNLHAGLTRLLRFKRLESYLTMLTPTFIVLALINLILLIFN
jgi:hypothetical protein